MSLRISWPNVDILEFPLLRESFCPPFLDPVEKGSVSPMFDQEAPKKCIFGFEGAVLEIFYEFVKWVNKNHILNE